MGRGSGTSAQAQITLRRTGAGSAAPSWWQPSPRPVSSAADDRVARAHRKVAREMMLYARDVVSSRPHPVPLHRRSPVVVAVRDQALCELARVMYCTPKRVRGLVGVDAVAEADQALARWADRHLSSQLRGVFDLASPAAYEHLVVALSRSAEPAELILGSDRTLSPRALSPAEWGFLLDDEARAQRDPRRALVALLQRAG